MGIRMGYWDCRACGTKRIAGPERQCQSCGQPRAADVQFYTDDAAEEVEDQELLARARAGVDWHCPYCAADNRAGATQCIGCGASTDGATQREVRTILDAPQASERRPSSKLPLIAGAALAFLLFLGLGAWALFFRTHDLAVEVTAKRWEKTLVVQRLETERKEAWTDDVPGGARRVDSYTKKRTVKAQEGTTKVKVGKKDLGNGFFEDSYEEKPHFVEKHVDATWVVYEIDRWRDLKTLKESKADGTEPAAPQFSPGPRERAGPRTSQIVLTLAGPEEKSYQHAFDADGAGRSKAASFDLGGHYTAAVNGVGMVLELR